VNLDWH
jgi:hypothetical protein